MSNYHGTLNASEQAGQDRSDSPHALSGSLQGLSIDSMSAGIVGGGPPTASSSSSPALTRPQLTTPTGPTSQHSSRSNTSFTAASGSQTSMASQSRTGTYDSMTSGRSNGVGLGAPPSSSMGLPTYPESFADGPSTFTSPPSSYDASTISMSSSSPTDASAPAIHQALGSESPTHHSSGDPPPPLQPSELPSRSSFSAQSNLGTEGRSPSFSSHSATSPTPILATSGFDDAPSSTFRANNSISDHSEQSSTVYSRTAYGSGSAAGTGTNGLGLPEIIPSPTDLSVGVDNPRASTFGMGMPGQSQASKGVVPESFDEGVLRALCDLDCALPLVTERIKQSIMSCKQVASFFRSRAELEEKYARGMLDHVRNSADAYGRSYCKAGSFVEAYHSSFRIHESMASNRLRFSQRLNETSDELLALAKEGERLRKQHKETGARFERNVQESDAVLEKAKARFDNTAEELERILIAKEGESTKDSGGITSSKEKRGLGKAMKQGMLFKGKSSANMLRQEDDVRGRMNTASEIFKKAVAESQGVKQEYFNLHLPKILRLLKECADEIDMGTQYHLTRYAFLYETTVAADGELLAPTDGSASNAGLKSVFESIDNGEDFKTFMQNFAVARGSMRGPRREGMYDEGYNPTLPPHVLASQIQAQAPQISSPRASVATESTFAATNGDNSSILNQGYPVSVSSAQPQIETPPRSVESHQPPPPMAPSQPQMNTVPATSSAATFGVELGEQMVRDGAEVPKIVDKCARAIEQYGLDSMGIYRLSGTTSKVQKLKAAFDRDIDNVDPMSEEFGSDINVVASALKLWFRELPEPLLTYDLYQRFIEAAGFDNDRLRHIRTHEVVNDLPDPNYACLKYFMAHLDKVRRHHADNSMNISNLAIVFGPTLLIGSGNGGFHLDQTPLQSKVIETILDHYEDIFVE